MIIFLTSKDTDEDVMRGFSMGAGDYIKKPFGKAELQSRVAAHLKAKEMKDELKRQNKELRSDMEKLNYMAFRDGLTGLYNRALRGGRSPGGHTGASSRASRPAM